MTDRPTGYSLGVRAAHLAAIILLALQLFTGARLAWLDEAVLSQGTAEFIDQFAPTGRIHLTHTVLGLGLVVVGLFYLVNLTVAGEAPRIFLLFLDRRYSFRKKLLYLFTFAVALISLLSGVTLYCGMYVGPGGYIFMKYLHYYCALFLLGFTIVHILETVTSRLVAVNSIFFARPLPGFVNRTALLAAGAAAVAVGVLFYLLTTMPSTLTCRKTDRPITVDGRAVESEWLGADSVVIRTSGGINFDGSFSQVMLKSLYDGQTIYFLLQWTDPTRSLNRHLVKTKAGWVEQASEYVDRSGESIYAEDKIALSFHRNRRGCVGSCHLRTGDRMGLHYSGCDTIDVWQWMAVGTNPAGEADDGWWAGYENEVVGGRHDDNIASGGHRSNLNEEWNQPYFLPTHIAERDYIWLDSRAYVAYHPDLDTFAIGARVPAVLVAPSTGDRGDVRARGEWRNGVWTVELSRRLSTGSTFDLPLKGGVYINIAPFDNADSRHAFHLVPIKLKVQP